MYVDPIGGADWIEGELSMMRIRQWGAAWQVYRVKQYGRIEVVSTFATEAAARIWLQRNG